MKKRKMERRRRRGTVVVSRWISRLGMSRRGVFDKVTCGDIRLGPERGIVFPYAEGIYWEAGSGEAKQEKQIQ
jgi:hypothetical protein